MPAVMSLTGNWHVPALPRDVVQFVRLRLMDSILGSLQPNKMEHFKDLKRKEESKKEKDKDYLR